MIDTILIFPSMHNDDLYPISTFHGTTVYAINYEQAEKRENEYRKSLIVNKSS